MVDYDYFAKSEEEQKKLRKAAYEKAKVASKGDPELLILQGEQKKQKKAEYAQLKAEQQLKNIAAKKEKRREKEAALQERRQEKAAELSKLLVTGKQFAAAKDKEAKK